MPAADLIFLHAPTVYDFLERPTLWGPTSDLVPSEPIFDMYPVGFSTMASYLQKAGIRTRIANLAAAMVRSEHFDVERFIARRGARVFGIDLHWLPHAHGSLAVAELVKRHHPEAPDLPGGFSPSYFHADPSRYPPV